MKITVYTTPDCTFSAAEKTYLQGKNLPFEEKNVKGGEAILTEMLKVGNNFAGTPVTKIVRDDNTEVVLKGFTQSEFDEALAPKKDVASAPAAGTPAEPGAQAPGAGAVAPAVSPAAVNMPPTMPSDSVVPQMPAVENGVPPVNVVAPAAPAAQPTQEVNPLDSILRDLQNKVAQESAAAAPAQPVPAAPSAPTMPTPVAPTAPAGSVPTVPDFGAKQ